VSPPLPGRLHVCTDARELAAATASWVVSTAKAAVAARGGFGIALAGGGTPRALYQLLAGSPHRDALDWGRWSVYFGDERACPPDDPESNDRLARETLLDHVPIPPDRVHRMEAERADLDAAAAEYSALLAATLPPGPGGAPRLDCIVLGLGGDGHTASLFPGSAALDVVDAWATRGHADYAPFDRITVTFPLINAGAAVAFLVAGEAKRQALEGVVAGTVPAARVRPGDGELHWFLDRAAAGDPP